MKPDQVMLTKQPIHSPNKDLFAYELLFKSPFNLRASDVGGELATNQVLMNYSSCVAEESIRYPLPVFINVTTSMFLAQSFFPVDSAKMIVEICDAESLDDTLELAITAWQKKGFQVSLENAERFIDESLEKLAKFDFLKFSADRLDLNARSEQLLTMIETVTTKFMVTYVHTPELFERYEALGFHFFQGYFLAKPEVVLGRSIKAGTAAATRVMNALDQPNITMDEITDLVAQDAKLSLQMLKIVNSPLFRLPAPVDDLKKALVFLGADQLRQWTMLIAFVANGECHIEASRLILMRAKLCQLLAEKNGLEGNSPATAFMIGLISGVDLLFKTSVIAFLEHISLAQEVEKALLESTGQLGFCLEGAMKMQYDFSGYQEQALQYDDADQQCFLQAEDWSRDVIDLLKQ